jgi:hypothetical protein
MANSRLKSTIKRKAIHNIVLFVFGFIIIITILIIFGPNLLTNFSLLAEKMQGNTDTTASTNQQNDSFVAPPTLNPVVDATNSAQITVSGFAEKNQTVSLYINGQLFDKTLVDDKNSFHFTSVTLQQGQNALKAKAENDSNKQSDYSNTLTISLIKGAPKLSIDQPQDGQGFSKSSSPSINIQGSTDIGDNVTVNGSWAIVDDQGRYNYLYTLKDGDNDIKVIATDDAGNQTTKEIHIHTQ